MGYELLDQPMPDDEALDRLLHEGDMLFESMPDWPADAVPVVLWPAPTLRAALAGAPGPALARVVAESTRLDAAADAPLDPLVISDLPEETLADLVTACGRLQSWAAGIQAQVVAERATRESSPLAHDSLVGQVTTELVVTQSEASQVVVRAESGTDHPTVIAALTTGRIDVKKAHTLLRSATQLTTEERAEAIDLYLPHAPTRTWQWLRTKLLAFAKSRHGSARTAREAADHRAVHLDRAENDMGWLSAYLPSVDAAAVWGVVDDMARQLRRTTGEERNLGQLRADCLTGIVTGRLLPGDRFANPGTTTGAKRAADPGTDPDTATTKAKAKTDESDLARPACTCGGRAPVQQVVQSVRVVPTRPVVRVTVPSSTLLGLDDAPGDLDGFGPVPADIARLIAQDATWQRLVTDPVTGILTDYSTTSYRPGKVLRAATTARDATCAFPGCDTRAQWCDLDHIEAFDNDLPKDSSTAGGRGQTRAHNLHPLCRRHHLLKTHAGWAVTRDPHSGITIWTAPTGRTHVRPPTVLDTHVELDRIEPDTSYDLTLRDLTGRRLPRSYRTAQPGAVSTTPPDDVGPPF